MRGPWTILFPVASLDFATTYDSCGAEPYEQRNTVLNFSDAWMGSRATNGTGSQAGT